ncbi:DEAD/DEAH box helicase [Acinetobacter baumannii]|uniref:DEAD/DEAH box helicase n=8 Tax=Acinetobacter baumannii TaxID=470 RepID=A0A1S2FT63_ACIBA|nr:DEAD/DEAH box helicase [Acinetobacter baumannii]KQK46207.1 hypothetical protein AQ482_09700 [Acinetobacter baumannii]MCE6434678.1 DEAD/DEAH box helicase [Acinetobacter baumannii]MCE6827690.1 DEAD/DEAH box helicase [Acinetobacter baumannii]MCZ0627322.1 DEAD/DEAH box helicase [Acinetobacter baumannii]MCZ0650693.1 DEAD/DEAH box helicase [Acinetobacter baumannii]
MNNWYNTSLRNLNNQEFNNWDQFLVSLIEEFNSHQNNFLVQDIVIRALERRQEIQNNFILDHLLGELGLFPYINYTNCSSKDKLRKEIFTTPQDDSKVFHIRQAEVFHRIMSGENVILSAPTSFGKSLIIEAIVSSLEFNNIVIVVPTIALMDELKRKLSKYNEYYKIITQINQQSSNNNIYIFTQERVLEYKDLFPIDFFIIDEFYKLAPTSENDERCDRLNLAFKKLYSKCKRFYMLGPKINGLVSGITDELRCTFLKFDSYITVATNEYYYSIPTKGKDSELDLVRDKNLFSILKSIGRNEQTVIYCKSPKRVSSLLLRILNSGLLKKDDINNDLAEWLASNFHKDWSLVKGVQYGIAYHHAQLPRAVASLIVDLFNSSKINILICTSTLIEGVNTNAKNIVIYDDCITKRTKLDMFTFNNIAGRSGRMFEHFIGNVYIFGSKPQVELPYIDVPVVTQSDNASDALLLHLGDEVTEDNKNRIKKFYDQKILPISILIKHQGVNPNTLIELAEAIIKNIKNWNNLMCWDGIYPNKYQLQHLSYLLFRFFNITSMASGSVRTERQLYRKLIDIIKKVDDKELIKQEYNYWKKKDSTYTIDDAIQSVFSIKKNLISYNLPRLIYAINDIQEFIFNLYNLNHGDYKAFAVSLENFYLPSAINSLEEFGIPHQISRKIFEHHFFDDPDNIDLVLNHLDKVNNITYSYLSPFEYTFVHKALSYT